jgi:mRNA interferase RelE/StbE
MRVEPTSEFLKLLRALRNDDLRRRLSDVVDRVEGAPTICDIPNLKKLKGHKTAYRIRVGDFRVGLFIEGDTAIFADFDHRKDIYNRFP